MRAICQRRVTRSFEFSTRERFGRTPCGGRISARCFSSPITPSHSRSWIPRWLVSYGLVPAIVRLNEISAQSAGWVAVPDCAQNQSLAILTSSICTVAARISPARPSLGSCGGGSNGGRLGFYTGLLQDDWNQLRLSDWRMCWRSSGKYSAPAAPTRPRNANVATCPEYSFTRTGRQRTGRYSQALPVDSDLSRPTLFPMTPLPLALSPRTPMLSPVPNIPVSGLAGNGLGDTAKLCP